MKFLKQIGLFSVAIVLCGCQSPPEENVVISKNDGLFDIQVIQSATESSQSYSDSESFGTESQEDVSAQVHQCNEQFLSTDGKVHFNLDFNVSIPNSHLPVVEVTPHNLTEEDVERVAKVLFGEADFYEAEPLGEEVYSKSELQEKINRLLNYTGNVTGNSALFEQAKETFIKQWSVMLETAPTEIQHIPCTWEYRKSSYYYYSPEEYASLDVSQDNDELHVLVKSEEIPYLYTVSTRNKSDFKVNNIHVYIDDGPSPFEADRYIFQNMLCQTEKPTEQDLEALKKKAEDLLQKMELGLWKADECYIEVADHNQVPEYIVVVKAVPEFQGVSAARRPQFSSIKGEDIYASNYYLSDAEFRFSKNGDLLSFDMYSPIDTASVINSNVQIMDFESIINRAKDQLSLSDREYYDRKNYMKSSEEELTCRVDISRADFGMVRVKAPNTDEHYYYVPGIIFHGGAVFIGEETGIEYDTSSTPGQTRILLILNVIDGSVVPIYN